MTDTKPTESAPLHPKEIAEETLQTLLEFVPRLIQLSQRATHPEEFQRLFDGIQTFIDAILATKEVIDAEKVDSVVELEKDLLAQLEQLLSARQAGDQAVCEKILLERLPNNLRKWQETGIPALIRLRDS